jgi:hypothetical protein
VDELGSNPPAIPEPPLPGGPPPVPPLPPTPPTPPAGFTPLPWEQPGYPFFAAIVETTKLFLTKPREAFERSSPAIGMGRPLLYGCILSFVLNFFTAIYQFWGSSFMQGMKNMPGMHDWMSAEQSIPPLAQLLGTIFASPFIIPLAILLVSGLVHLCLLLLGGASGGYKATVKAECYAYAPAILGIVPLCGSVAAAIWTIVVLVIGLTVVHRISTGKAIAAVLIPFALCCACLFPLLMFAKLGHMFR